MVNIAVHLCRFLVAVAVLAAGSVAAQAQPIPIRIGWQPDANGGFFVARKQKLFEKAGLQPEYVKFLSGPAMFSALQSQSIDVAEFTASPFVAGVSNGVPMVAIASAFNEGRVNTLVVPAKSTAKSIKDLKGKKIAATRGSMSYLGLALALSKNQMAFTDIEYLNMPVPTIVPAFQHGDVDAAWAWAPWGQKMEAEGGRIIDTVGDLPTDLWVARTAWLKEQPEAAVRFIAALDEAAEMMRKDPELTIPDIAEALAITPEMAREIMKKVTTPTVAEQLDPNNPSSVMHFKTGDKGLASTVKIASEFFIQQGIIKSFPPLDTVFDATPITTYAKRKKP